MTSKEKTTPTIRWYKACKHQSWWRYGTTIMQLT